MARDFWFDSIQVGDSAGSTGDGVSFGWTSPNITVNGGYTNTGGPFNDRLVTNLQATRVFGINAGSVAVGHWQRMVSHTALNVFQGLDGANAQFSVRRTATGTIEVRTGGNAGTIIGTSAAVIVLNAWQFLEIEATIHNTTGEVKIYLDGTLVLTATGNTRGGSTNFTVDRILFGNASGSYSSIYAIAETAASTATRLGPVKPYRLVATGDGFYTAWTANTGTRWQAIDEVPTHDVDVTYIQSNTPGDKNSIDITDTVAGIGTIFGFSHIYWARRDDAGPHTMRGFLRNAGGTEQVEPTQTLTATYVGYGSWREFSPFTGGSTRWTASEIDGLQLAEELVT